MRDRCGDGLIAIHHSHASGGLKHPATHGRLAVHSSAPNGQFGRTRAAIGARQCPSSQQAAVTRVSRMDEDTHDDEGDVHGL